MSGSFGATREALGSERSGDPQSPLNSSSTEEWARTQQTAESMRRETKADRVARSTHKIQFTHFISHNSIHTFHTIHDTHFTNTNTNIGHFLPVWERFQPTHLSSWTVPSFSALMRSGKRTTFLIKSQPVFQFDVSLDTPNSSAGNIGKI